MPIWIPQHGPQVRAVQCPIDFPFFGGSRGGGKSDCLIGRHIIGADRYKRHWNGLVVRRKYKEFNEMRRRVDGLITEGLPAERIGGDQQINHVRFDNGADIIFAAVTRLELVNDWVGHAFTEISIDECTTFPFFTKMVDKLKGSLRSAQGIPCHMFGTGNPGGSGHMQVKEYFKLGSAGHVDGIKPYDVFQEKEETRVFIPSFLHENKVLCENDPKYVRRLLSISDPALRRAWLLGDWDVFIGQAFYWSQKRHIIPDFPIPDYVPVIMTYDWGYGKPFSIGWWWVDADGRVYRCMEWYGWNKTPDEGLRIEDSKVAEGILEREHKAGIHNRVTDRLAGPDCFSKKPNYQGGGQGPSTAEVFRGFGIQLRPGDPERKLKIRQFRERLKVPDNNIEMPMMVVYESCTNFIRTIPYLAMDEDKPEDIDTDQEDHVYDEACVHQNTLIQTMQGLVKIKDLVGTCGEILTIGDKYAKYHDCRLTRKLADTVEVLFSDGHRLICTPDHEILKSDGTWVKAVDSTSEWRSGSAKPVDKFTRLYGVKKSNAVRYLARQNYGGKTIKAVKVRPFGKHDVYCLVVDDYHSFAIANGVIVQNCHIAMSRPLSIPEDQIHVMIESEIQKAKRKALTPAHQKIWSELDKIRASQEEAQE